MGAGGRNEEMWRVIPAYLRILTGPRELFIINFPPESTSILPFQTSQTQSHLGLGPDSPWQTPHAALSSPIRDRWQLRCKEGWSPGCWELSTQNKRLQSGALRKSQGRAVPERGSNWELSAKLSVVSTVEGTLDIISGAVKQVSDKIFAAFEATASLPGRILPPEGVTVVQRQHVSHCPTASPTTTSVSLQNILLPPLTGWDQRCLPSLLSPFLGLPTSYVPPPLVLLVIVSSRWVLDFFWQPISTLFQ